MLEYGTKVRLTKSCAKWYLDHPDVYEKSGGMMDAEDRRDYNIMMQMAMLVLLGENVYGYVVGTGAAPKYLDVIFITEFGLYKCYFEYRTHVVKA